MADRFQSVNRGAIRRSIGINLGIVKLGAATSTVDSSSLLDTKTLIGPDDEFNGQEVLIYDATGSIGDGESSIVDDFSSATSDATCAPVFTASITTLDKYEMWTRPWRISDINEVINQAINEATGQVYPIKETHTAFTEDDKYLYNELSGFTHLSKVEYVYSKGTYYLLDNCDIVWTAGSANVTVTADSAFEKVGTACVKAVEDGNSGAGAILAYKAISSKDISGCDKVEFWMYSSIALTAGQLQIKLDDTAAIASALEAIDIPAMTAATWYKHSLTLANPHLDTAIISIGIYQVSDVGAFTFYVDEVDAVMSTGKDYKGLPAEYWGIVKGSTPYLQISPTGLSVTGYNTQMRLTGYSLATRLDADATAADIDPAFIISKCCERLLISHAKSQFLDIQDKASLAVYWRAEAEKKLRGMATAFPGTTRSVS